MPDQQTFPVHLFYSYSHKDEGLRSSLERSLALLKRRNILRDWSDHKILPGQHISNKIRKEMEKSDIIVFLLSQYFIASDECMKEWNEAKQLSNDGRVRFRVPIILTDCAWQDILVEDNIKALPTDGKPVEKYTRQADAWQVIYEGIKSIVEEIRSNFSPRTDFMKSMESTDFVSQNHINLLDIFVFPTLSCFQPQRGMSGQFLEESVTNTNRLFVEDRILIHGEDMSGKTALARYLFLSLVRETRPVLFVDLKEIHSLPNPA